MDDFESVGMKKFKNKKMLELNPLAPNLGPKPQKPSLEVQDDNAPLPPLL
jgi:hypothetical protein